MGIPIRRLQNEIDSKDLALYMAYDSVDPFGDKRYDLGVGMICNTLARVFGNKRSKLSDFILDYKKVEKVRKTDKQIFNIFKMATRISGGKVIE